MSTPCAQIAYSWDMDVEDFIAWNASVGQNCDNMVPNMAYCVSALADDYEDMTIKEPPVDPSGSPEESEDEEYVLQNDTVNSPSTPPAIDGENGDPIESGDCLQKGPGQEDCTTTASLWSITEAEFIAMNPSVGIDCSNIIFGEMYCVQAKTHPLLDTSTTSECIQHQPYPDPHHLIALEGGSTCKSFANFWYRRESDFIAWNPVVGGKCENFEEGRRYCVEVEDAAYEVGENTYAQNSTGGYEVVPTAALPSASSSSSSSSSSPSATTTVLSSAGPHSSIKGWSAPLGLAMTHMGVYCWL